MPRYFFHVHDGVEVRDTEGSVLGNISEARKQAIQTAGETIAGSASGQCLGDNWTMEVATENGADLVPSRFQRIGISRRFCESQKLRPPQLAASIL